MAHKNLNNAQGEKNDEFYTQLEDIEKEMKHYKAHFKGKIVLCNCDDPYESNFFKYFAMNFNYLGLKKLIATCYATSPIMYTQLTLFGDEEPVGVKNKGKKPYKIEITKIEDMNGDGAIDLEDVEALLKKNKPKVLKGDGDFRSEECIKLLKESDIIVTNPPFSLFREYIAQLMEYDKKFIILSNMNAIAYKDFFPWIMQNRIWVGNGFNMSLVFKTPYPNKLDANRKFVISKGYNPDDGYVKTPAIAWFTNLDIKKRHEDLIMWKKYTPEEYPHYDNYDAINVDKVSEIPGDYYGMMGVPITFLDSYNSSQFEILGITDRHNPYGLTTKIYTKEDCPNYGDCNRRGAIKLSDGTIKSTYARIFIKRKKQGE